MSPHCYQLILLEHKGGACSLLLATIVYTVSIDQLRRGKLPLHFDLPIAFLSLARSGPCSLLCDGRYFTVLGAEAPSS